MFRSQCIRTRGFKSHSLQNLFIVPVRLYSSVGRACASYLEYELSGHSFARSSHKRKVRGSIPRGGLKHAHTFPRDSSVGRAVDCRVFDLFQTRTSIGRRFDSVSREDETIAILSAVV